MAERGGWIKIHRELLDKPIWQLSSAEQKVILITLLMIANHKSKKWEWNGGQYVCEPGQFVTSLSHIATKCGPDVSIRNVRTAIQRFEKLNFLTNESTKTGRLISIVNWELYQGIDRDNDKDSDKDLTKSRQRPDKDLTTNKNDKEIKNDKEEKKKDIYEHFFEEVWRNYPRKLGKGSVSKKAKKELYDAGMDVVMAAIKKYQRETEHQEERFILYGSTFFNGRWKDYVPKQKPQSTAQEEGIFDRFKNLPPEMFQDFRKQGIISDEGGVCCGDATKEQILILQKAGAL